MILGFFLLLLHKNAAPNRKTDHTIEFMSMFLPACKGGGGGDLGKQDLKVVSKEKGDKAGLRINCKNAPDIPMPLQGSLGSIITLQIWPEITFALSYLAQPVPRKGQDGCTCSWQADPFNGSVPWHVPNCATICSCCKNEGV